MRIPLLLKLKEPQIRDDFENRESLIKLCNKGRNLKKARALNTNLIYAVAVTPAYGIDHSINVDCYVTGLNSFGTKVGECIVATN